MGLRRRPRQAGFTLLELMAVLAVAALLAALAGPSFSTLVDNQRLRNASFDLVSDLLLARSHAVLRHANVAVTPTASGADGWSQGWTVTSGGETLASRSGLDARLRLAATAGGNAAASLAIGPEGRVIGATPVSIEVGFASPAPSGVTPSCIRLDATGRPRSDKGAC